MKCEKCEKCNKVREYLLNDDNIIDLYRKHDFRKYPNYNFYNRKEEEDVTCVELYGYYELLEILDKPAEMQLDKWNKLKEHFKKETIKLEMSKEEMSIDNYVDRKAFLKEVLEMMEEIEEE